MMTGKKVNTKPVDYAALNQLSKDFETRFVPQTKLSAKQAFWSQNSRNSKETNLSTSTTIVEVPKELPKVELQAKDMTIKKLKAHIKRIFETSTSKSVKKDFDEIETINIELEHRVTRLIPKNEHLK
nr:hypothetical protein [Tanacetum cinerariifolium]